MSNIIPKGWSIQTLGEKVHILSGFPFKSSLFTDDSNFMGIIRIRDLEKQSIETFYAGDFEETYVVKKGDVLIGMDGDFNIVKWKSRNALLNQRVCKIKAETGSSFHTEFLFQSLKEDLLSINAATGATTVKHLSVKDIKGIEKAYPPLPEQQKIATILSSVDTVIEKTRAQIDKLKDLKTGMMQELLTKGIGHTEFKDSPVGRIPAGWEVRKIDDFSKKVGSGVTPRGGSESYVEVGIPLIRSQNVHFDGLRLDDVSYITELQHQKMSGSQLKPGDVLLNITGASIGRCYYLPHDFKEGNVNQHVCIIRVKESVISPIFLTLFLSSEFGQKQIMSLQAGGNREGLNFQQIRSISLPLPELREQKGITGITSSIEESIRMKSKKLSGLIKIKKALMQDLLAGKVRVLS